jgi:hypothetical protein
VEYGEESSRLARSLALQMASCHAVNAFVNNSTSTAGINLFMFLLQNVGLKLKNPAHAFLAHAGFFIFLILVGGRVTTGENKLVGMSLLTKGLGKESRCQAGHYSP